jgi:hypothetical protein
MNYYYGVTTEFIVPIGEFIKREEADIEAIDKYNIYQSNNGYLILTTEELNKLRENLK